MQTKMKDALKVPSWQRLRVHPFLPPPFWISLLGWFDDLDGLVVGTINYMTDASFFYIHLHVIEG